MGSYFGTTGMWYKNGTFYELNSTHVEFFLQNPEKLGFTQEEKERLCVENGLSPDATSCSEQSQQRVDLILEVLKRGAIRIRFYGGQTSVQCYDRNNSYDFKQLKNCVIDGLGKCFGESLTVMDTKGWGDNINSYGWGTQIKDFIASSAHKAKWNYVPDSGFCGRNGESMKSIFR